MRDARASRFKTGKRCPQASRRDEAVCPEQHDQRRTRLFQGCFHRSLLLRSSVRAKFWNRSLLLRPSVRKTLKPIDNDLSRLFGRSTWQRRSVGRMFVVLRSEAVWSPCASPFLVFRLFARRLSRPILQCKCLFDDQRSTRHFAGIGNYVSTRCFAEM